MVVADISWELEEEVVVADISWELEEEEGVAVANISLEPGEVEVGVMAHNLQ